MRTAVVLLLLAVTAGCAHAQAKPAVADPPKAATQVEVYVQRLKDSRDRCEVDVAGLLAEIERLKAEAKK